MHFIYVTGNNNIKVWGLTPRQRIIRQAKHLPNSQVIDDLGGLEIVDGHTVLAAEPAEAAAKCQSGNASGGVDADWCGEAVGLGGGVEVRERGTALDRMA